LRRPRGAARPFRGHGRAAQALLDHRHGGSIAPVPKLDAQEYQALAEACLDKVARWLEDFDPDEVDYATGDGKLTLEFPDGMKFVLNRQGAASQMWFAAVDRAWHYGWDAARRTWIDDRDGHDLYARLGEVVSTKIGRRVTL
jgi:CyaY protein